MDVITGIGLVVAALSGVAAISQLLQFCRERRNRKGTLNVAPPRPQLPESASPTTKRPPLVILPRRLEPFINRTEQLKEIDEALRTMKVVQLQGLGGIGKTELAVEAAYRLKDFFTDGVIHFDALSYLTLEDVLNALARAFDVDIEQLPLNEKKLIIRTRLLSKKVLLVLDNVETGQVVNDLLNILPESAALITSRPSFIIPKAKVVTLGPMEQEHAIELFEVNSGRSMTDGDRRMAADICRQLGAFPLAIELAAKQLRISRVDISTLSRRLATTKSLEAIEPKFIDDRSVRASFNSTYRLLSDADQQLFTSLGAFAGQSFSIEAIRAVSQNAHGDEVMDRLVALSLVKVDEGRYGLHPLLKLFARENMNGLGAYQRMAEYYATYAQSHTNDFNQLEIERANIQEAVNWSASNGDDEMVITLVKALLGEEPEYGFLAQRGHWNDALVRIVQAIGASSNLSDALLEARFHLSHGLFNYWIGKNDEARNAYSLAQEGFETAEDLIGLVHVCWQRGYIEDDQDNYSKAKELYSESLALSLQIGDKNLICRSRELVGVVEYHRGDLNEARRHLEASLQESIALGNEGRIARTQRRLAAVARKQAELSLPEQSRALANEARSLLENALSIEKNRRSIGRLLRQSGLLEQFAQNDAKAREFYQKALDIFTDLGNHKGVAATLYNLGTVAEISGNLAQAEEYYAKSMTIAERISVRSGVALNLLGLASVARARKDCNRALPLVEQAVETLTAIESPHVSFALRLLDVIRADCDQPTERTPRLMGEIK